MASFPIQDGIPILIDDKRSIFSIKDILSHNTQYKYNKLPNKFVFLKKLYSLIKSIMPDIDKNIKGEPNLRKFNLLLHQISSNPKVLIIGCKVLGIGVQSIALDSSIELIESDVVIGPRTKIILDAHNIPFDDESFDGVIIQAVLEHVVNPYKCVEEIYRILNKNGFVYAETAFMQQVHGRAYDFTRFTYLGHLRLFRKFEIINSGAVCGPGMALAWAYRYFLLSFTSSKIFREILDIIVKITSFYFKYFDKYLIDRVESLDAASGIYFLGRKSFQKLSDKHLIKYYKGGF